MAGAVPRSAAGGIVSFIEFRDVTKKYTSGSSVVLANNKMNFSVERGEFVIMVGPSGAGKSTTLNILGGIDQNDEGEVIVDGKDVGQFSQRELTNYRRYQIGFVFQNYNLIGNLTATENVEMATQLVEDAMDPVEALEAVGLGHRLTNFPAQLSGGEQQRVAIARAMAKNPSILLCDEPTGALDYQTGKDVLRQLHETGRRTGTTVIIVTHNSAIKPTADRVIEIADAKVRRVQRNDNPTPIQNIEW